MRLHSRTLSLAVLLGLSLGLAPANSPFDRSDHLHPVDQIRMELREEAMFVAVERAIEHGKTVRSDTANAARLQAEADAIAEQERIAEEASRREAEAEAQRQREEEERRRAEEQAAAEAAAAEQAAQEATPAPEPAPRATSGVPWDDIARCESGYGGEPNWNLNTGNGYYGGLQFDKSSWDWAGGTQYTAYPHEASREQQIATAEKLLSMHPAGLGAWPACTRKLGLR